MSLLEALRQRWLLTATLVLSCAAFTVIGIWRTKATVGTAGVFPKASAPIEKPKSLQERIRRGLGSEVRFTKQNDSSEEVEASVDSLAEFIYARAGLKMSDDTRSALILAERRLYPARDLACKSPS